MTSKIKKLGGRLLKDSLLKDALSRRASRQPSAAPPHADYQHNSQQAIYTDIRQFPAYQDILLHKAAAEQLQLQNPFFKSHEGVATDRTVIEGREYINFSSYNYLGLNQDARVQDAAKAAIDRYGVSSSASRLVSGERPIQRELERALAELHGVDDALLFVSGHATNVTSIGYLFGPKDLIVHDALIHNSVIEGARLSQATRLSFAHNDWRELDSLLAKRRHNFERVLVVVEGLYSMDGDSPELSRLVEIKQKHNAFLMVDEAHSIGVLGKSGRGIAESCAVAGRDVDIWMGTLSKTLSSCGGYIAGSTELVEILKAGAPGFLYSVGIVPALAASALQALQIMLEEPQRIAKLHFNANFFDNQAKQRGLNTGEACKYAIVPVIVGSSIKAVQLSQQLFERGINVQPIIYPAVEERRARLRFFISSSHSEQQIVQVVDALADSLAQLS